MCNRLANLQLYLDKLNWLLDKLGKSGIICLMTGHTKIGPIPMLTKKGEERLYSFCLECKKEWFTK